MNTSIENIDVVYGGVRGTTLSSRHNLRHWQTVVQSGVKTIVELREGDHSDRLCSLCEQNNIRYFAFPLDSHTVPNEVIALKLHQLFEIIDGGDFYIACAMGLHRTDMALSIYWMFHGADIEFPPPYLKGHFPMLDSGRKGVEPSKIFRRLNSLYEYLCENRLIEIPDKPTFALRRKGLIEYSKTKASIKGTMKTNYTTFSEAGKRIANQDVCRVIEFPEHDRTLMVVCDGMGGHAMGDVAAETVCNAICGFLKQNTGVADSENKIIDACKVASDTLYARSRIVSPIEMGTTFVMASIEGRTITIAHCGDSRCYLLRDGGVVHQTEDHADPYCGSEVVARCFFSMNPEVAVPDIARFEVKSGDRIFLCSDGVYKAMAPQILAARLQDDKPLEEVVDVIKFMCEKFSTDNYTGILAEIL